MKIFRSKKSEISKENPVKNVAPVLPFLSSGGDLVQAAYAMTNGDEQGFAAQVVLDESDLWEAKYIAEMPVIRNKWLETLDSTQVEPTFIDTNNSAEMSPSGQSSSPADTVVLATLDEEVGVEIDQAVANTAA